MCTFIEPLRLAVGNEFNLNNVKEIKVSDEFLGLNMDITGCQNDRSLTDCKTEQYLTALRTQCKCLPLSVSSTEKVCFLMSTFIYNIHKSIFFLGTLHNNWPRKMSEKFDSRFFSMLVQMWRNGCH